MIVNFQTFWEDVRSEMIDEKKLDPAAADRIGTYVKLKGGQDLIDALLADEDLMKQKSAMEGLQDLKLLLKYCELYGILDKVWCRGNYMEFLTGYGVRW